MTLLRDHETQATPPTRKKRLFFRSFAVIAALAIFWAVAGIFLYVTPPADEPKHADVLFVLGPPDQRMVYAEQLMRQGYAPTLAVSSPVDKDGRFTADVCRDHRSYRVICFHSDPFTTQGEARALRDLSNQYGWKSANVLTAQFHVTRARVIVGRCYSGDIQMVADRMDLSLISWAYQYLYQSAAFVKVALHPDC
ncbi:YdcF family protein [Arthrobacter sp. FW306-2-2C-D06B]|uniref:YdcF family protein n=1 Tax=Arthrobacter sp. FW306-2-2C-D06B TaxID=2879618 RepID=UPI001F25BB8B|nr:ElyC/SanA/YdcF family protein [Arthrobacter sp. FW306-2-2C-D06B]UKA57984.1 YdcF family protein [Arthrobacter sp. FW306-2-2C-D06B]